MGTKWELTILFPDTQNLADTLNPPLAGGTDINQYCSQKITGVQLSLCRDNYVDESSSTVSEFSYQAVSGENLLQPLLSKKSCKSRFFINFSLKFRFYFGLASDIENFNGLHHITG